MTNFEFDAIDQSILDERMAAREQCVGPRNGDFMRFPSGEIERVCGFLVDAVQTAPAWAGSYHLHSCGSVCYSGSLNPPIPKDSLALTDESLPGRFWFFHHGTAGAHRGVYFEIPCRVYATTADYAGFISRSYL